MTHSSNQTFNAFEQELFKQLFFRTNRNWNRYPVSRYKTDTLYGLIYLEDKTYTFITTTKEHFENRLSFDDGWYEVDISGPNGRYKKPMKPLPK